MADLRIVDAPLLSTVKGTEKIPTGGEGNFSVSVDQVADFAKLKWFLATEEYVDNAVGNVQADLNLHKNNVNNPHQVTKVQVGLGNVDNTADVDKPIGSATQAALATLTQTKADKTYVDSQLNTKADKSTTYSKIESDSLVSTKSDTSYVNTKYSSHIKTFLNTGAALSNTVNGEYFFIISSDSEKVEDLYLNVNGVATNQNKSELSSLLQHNSILGRDVTGAHQATSISTASGVNQQQINDYLTNDSNKNLKHYTGADHNGVLNTSLALQAYVNDVNAQQLSVLYAPTVWENYVIDDSIICEYPISIKGDKGANQNRYFGKKGNFLIGATNVAFKFGNGRESYPEVTYVADQYNLSNIGFLSKNTVDEFTKTAIQWHVKTNAPDRGLMLKEVSASRMNKVFHLLSGAETDLANLTVQNSCLSNNYYVIYSDGGLNGLNFINNQAEQNYFGTIYGCFNGAVNIADNMLEGSHNTVTITPVPITGSRLKFNFERNYVESCTGDFLISLDTTSNGQVTIKDNFHFDLNQYEANGQLTDVVRLRGAFEYINNVDDFSVTLHSIFNIVAEPLLSRNNDYFVRVNADNLNKIQNILTYNYNTGKQVIKDNKQLISVPAKVSTNLGDLYYLNTFGNRFTLPLSTQAGDIIKLTVAYYSNAKFDNSVDTAVNINDSTLSYGAVGSINIEPSNGVVKVASFVTMVGFNTNSLSVFLGYQGFDNFIVGAFAEKIGASASAEDKVKTYMTLPQIYTASDGLNFEFTLDATTGVEIAPNSSVLKNITIYGVSANNDFTFKLRNPNSHIRFAVDSIGTDSIVIRVFNSSATTISLTSDVLEVNVK